jgi:hypothetical protein
MVYLMHILIPSMVMKEVGNIKEKLLDSVALYYQNMAKGSSEGNKEGVESKDGDDTMISKSGESKPFNAAKYLFLSYRMAQQYPELKVAKVISQFSTPWPKQSYQHVADVSKGYDGRFSAISRSASMVVLFFLTNLLSVPLGMQDMIMQMVTTTSIGYATLFHIQLYQIYPILVIVPALFLGGIIHFIVRSTRANSELEQRMFLKRGNHNEQQFSGAIVDENNQHAKEEAVRTPETTLPHRQYEADEASESNASSEEQNDGDDDNEEDDVFPDDEDTNLHLSPPTLQHKTRRQSVAHGISLAVKAQDQLKDFDSSLSNNSISNYSISSASSEHEGLRQRSHPHPIVPMSTVSLMMIDMRSTDHSIRSFAREMEINGHSSGDWSSLNTDSENE